MTRFLLAALAALILFVPATSAHIRGTQFAPVYTPQTPRVPDAEVGSYDKIHNVAVLSGVGMTFELQSRGFFTPKNGTLDVAAWRLDERIEATVRNYLRGRFTFVNIAADRAKLAAIPTTAQHQRQLESFLKTLPNQEVDAFILVRPDSQSGIQLQSVRHGDNILWARYEMDVIDAHSLKLIAKSTSRLQLREGARANFPGLVLGKAFEMDETLALSPEKQEKLHTLTLELLNSTLAETIRSLRFGVVLPPVGDPSIAPPVNVTLLTTPTP